MSRSSIVLLTICLWWGTSAALAQASTDEGGPGVAHDTSIVSHVDSTLPDSPGTLWTAARSDDQNFNSDTAPTAEGDQSHAPPPASPAVEHYHWKGLLLQSFAFMMLEDAVRIMSANREDRHLLLNKPYWSDYWASLQQFNMRRWNDGDSVLVNYVGHPLQGATAGYIEEQNDPRGRMTVLSRDPAYWKSQWRAFLWSTLYSTQSEIGPFGEAAIFNEGGYTYPLHCHKNQTMCQTPIKYTNNTGWVDFIVTPVAGSLWMIGEDALDKFISDPLVHAHPHALGYKILRGGLNPPRSLANMLRGQYPWFRDYEHPEIYESTIIRHFDNAMSAEPHDHVDLFLHYTALGLSINTATCQGCRNTTTGAGMEFGFAVRRYLDIVVDTSIQPGASPGSSLNIGGTLWTGNIGVRSGYSGKYFAVKLTLAPGFASYSRTQATPDSPLSRSYNFAAVAAVSTDVRFTSHLAFRVATEQMLIRYKSLYRDPPGIGTPPNLSFLSHDNYINSTNWGVSLGPVVRF